MQTWNQTSTDIARAHTSPGVNKRIDSKVQSCVHHLAQQDPHAIGLYLVELEREWDLNRVLTVGVSGVALAGSLVALSGGRASRWVAALSSGALLVHGLLGFGPLAALARAAGVRTRKEIDLEKFALKGLRGDFSRIPHEGGPLVRANAALVAAQS